MLRGNVSRSSYSTSPFLPAPPSPPHPISLTPPPPPPAGAGHGSRSRGWEEMGVGGRAKKHPAKSTLLASLPLHFCASPRLASFLQLLHSLSVTIFVFLSTAIHSLASVSCLLYSVRTTFTPMPTPMSLTLTFHFLRPPEPHLLHVTSHAPTASLYDNAIVDSQYLHPHESLSSLMQLISVSRDFSMSIRK